MADLPPDQPGLTDEPDTAAPGWVGWFAWGWLVLVALVAVSQFVGLDRLRLALDFQRHLHP